MVVDEQSRHRLYRRLEEVLGSEEAATLMEHLPPTGWGDVATKHDLERLKAEIDAELQRLRGDLLERMASQSAAFTRSLVVGNSVAILTVAGIAFAAARLI
jgi:hypothetical protein